MILFFHREPSRYELASASFFFLIGHSLYRFEDDGYVLEGGTLTSCAPSQTTSCSEVSQSTAFSLANGIKEISFIALVSLPVSLAQPPAVR